MFVMRWLCLFDRNLKLSRVFRMVDVNFVAPYFGGVAVNFSDELGEAHQVTAFCVIPTNLTPGDYQNANDLLEANILTRRKETVE